MGFATALIAGKHPGLSSSSCFIPAAQKLNLKQPIMLCGQRSHDTSHILSAMLIPYPTEFLFVENGLLKRLVCISIFMSWENISFSDKKRTIFLSAILDSLMTKPAMWLRWKQCTTCPNELLIYISILKVSCLMEGKKPKYFCCVF